MTLTQVWGALLIFILCPLVGALPLIGWITHVFKKKRLTPPVSERPESVPLATGPVSIATAFDYGRIAGLLALGSEALKGVGVVLLARVYFPADPVWELMALLALVMGRYWAGYGAGTANVIWGYAVHDWQAAGLALLIGGISTTLFRQQRQGQLVILVLMPLILALRHIQEGQRIIVAIALSIVLSWIQQKGAAVLKPEENTSKSQSLLGFFRSDRAIISLDRRLDARNVGTKAAELSRLKRAGYPIPDGWVLPPGDDAQLLVQMLHPDGENPLAVRSSALGEAKRPAAPGQYATFLDIIDRPGLEDAISRCRQAYNAPDAVQSRRDRNLPDRSVAVLVQQQVCGLLSGTACSRDPITRQGNEVLIEIFPDKALQHPPIPISLQQYRITPNPEPLTPNPEPLTLNYEPLTPNKALLQQIAQLVHHLEENNQNTPQEIEWSYDGQTLWLLQVRPRPDLLPIWTHQLAANILPGRVHPLTASIEQPLLCAALKDLLQRSEQQLQGQNCNQLLTFRHCRVYINALLLESFRRRFGLSCWSLQQLFQGKRFQLPPIRLLLSRLPILLPALRREFLLAEDFRRDKRQHFAPALADLARLPACNSQQHCSKAFLSPLALLERIETILTVLQQADPYRIRVSFSLALRQTLLGVTDGELDWSQLPAVASLRSLQEIAIAARHLFPNPDGLIQQTNDPAEASSSLFALLADSPDGQAVLDQLATFLECDAPSERLCQRIQATTNIATPTWRENPRPMREQFAQFFFNPPPETKPRPRPSWKAQPVQHRLHLQGQIHEVCYQLRLELRWSFVALETLWLESGLLGTAGDIFFLEWAEIRQLIQKDCATLAPKVASAIAERREQFEQDQHIVPVPNPIYGQTTSLSSLLPFEQPTPTVQSAVSLAGIGVSPGEAEGPVKILQPAGTATEIPPETILVIPRTIVDWVPLLSNASGAIAEIDNPNSHGAIAARACQIPLVMAVPHVSQLLKDGQWVRINGQQGTIEIL